MDVVSSRMCVIPTPKITSLADLQALLGLSFVDKTAAGGNATGGNPGFVLTGHSSSVVARYVSPINPRSIVFTPIEAGSAPGKSLA